MSIALATTRLQQFWPEARPLTLLGTWCVPERELWDPCARAQYRVLPYPWEDRRRFDEAALYVLTVHERLLRQVADGLNAVHGVNQSLRYWRIVAGPWLLIYLESMYDRYVCLRDLLDREPDVDTIGLDADSFVVPPDTREFMSRFISCDEYNLQLYTRVLDALGVALTRKPLDRERHPSGRQPDARTRAVDWVRQQSRGAQINAARRLPVNVFGVIAPMRDRLRLLWMSRGRVGVFYRFNVPTRLPAVVSPEMRRSLAGALRPRDEFERVVVTGLAQDMPMSHLESFAARRRAAVVGAPPKVIMSTMGWYTDEGLKLLAAETQETGGRLVVSQHGGYYGMLSAMASEVHELRFADLFCCRGWREPLVEGAPLKPMPPFGPTSVSRRSGRPGGPVVLVTDMHLRYLYRFQSHPVGSQCEKYLDREIALARALDSERRQRLLVRLYYEDYGWNCRDRWVRAIPDVSFDTTATPIAKHFRDAALLVIDHPSTTLLEALAADVPCVLTWDPTRFTMRPAAAAMLRELRDAGVYYDTPEAAAAQVNVVADCSDDWWHSEQVQRARRRFCAQFAVTSDRWLEDWSRLLLECLSEVKRSAAAARRDDPLRTKRSKSMSCNEHPGDLNAL